MLMRGQSLDIAALHEGYRSGRFTPLALMRAVIARLQAEPERNAWISRLPDEQLLLRAQQLQRSDPATLPLYGVPFAIKDNIDLAELPTTAACPAFSYLPVRSATAVERLIAAGAMRSERQKRVVVRTENQEDLAGHVERDDADLRAAFGITPGRRRPLAVQETVAAAPNEVVLVAELHQGALADATQERGMELRVVFARPAPDVLKRIPVRMALRRIGREPNRRIRDVLRVFIAPLAGSDLTALVEVGA